MKIKDVFKGNKFGKNDNDSEDQKISIKNKGISAPINNKVIAGNTIEVSKLQISNSNISNSHISNFSETQSIGELIQLEANSTVNLNKNCEELSSCNLCNNASREVVNSNYRQIDYLLKKFASDRYDISKDIVYDPSEEINKLKYEITLAKIFCIRIPECDNHKSLRDENLKLSRIIQNINNVIRK